MRVLITNDDGISSDGFHALVRVFAAAHEVFAIAPSDDRSGSSAALTVRRDMDAQEAPEIVRLGAAAAYQLDGTPATCVILGSSGLLVPRPDLVVSGVNPGPNLGYDIYLSGTVGAALIATTLGIPGIAVSCLRDPSGRTWVTAARTARRVAELLAGPSRGDGAPGDRVPLVNINVPSQAPRSVTATTVAGCHVISQSVVEQARVPGETRRGLRLELRMTAPSRYEPGSDAWAFFSGDTSVTVLDRPGDRPSRTGAGARIDLGRYLAQHLTETRRAAPDPA